MPEYLLVVGTGVMLEVRVECNTPDIRSNVSRVKDNKDPIGRDFASYKIVDLDETYPKYIRENKEKFSHLIKE